MGKRNPKVDEYIAKSADFAKPVLSHFREIVHQACPEVEEEMKWSFPHFVYKGIICSMASFKAHCAIHFWKGDLIFGEKKSEDAMGQFGRITSLSDLPPDRQLAGAVKEAARLNETGVKAPARMKKNIKKDLEIPEAFVKAMKKNKKAEAAFEKLSPSHKREYVEWITEAKTDATRDRRMATALEWIVEGKSRHWKYQRSS